MGGFGHSGAVQYTSIHLIENNRLRICLGRAAARRFEGVCVCGGAVAASLAAAAAAPLAVRLSVQ